MDSVPTAHLVRPSVTPGSLRLPQWPIALSWPKIHVGVRLYVLENEKEIPAANADRGMESVNFTGILTRREYAGRIGSAWPANCHLAQRRDPLIQRRVCAEERRENRARSENRLDDGKGRSGLGNIARNAVIVRSELLQGPNQAGLLADHLGAGLV